MNSSKPKPNNNNKNKPIVYKNRKEANEAVRSGQHFNKNHVKYMKNGQVVNGILKTEKELTPIYNNNYYVRGHNYVNIQRIVDEKGYIYKNLEAAKKALENGRHRYIKKIRYRGKNGKNIIEKNLKTIEREENVFLGETNGMQKRPVEHRIMVN